MAQKDSKAQRRARGEKDIQVWLNADTVKALGKLQQAYPHKNQTDLVNEALLALADQLPEHEENNWQDGGPDEKTKQWLERLEKRVERLEAKELDEVTKQLFYEQPSHLESNKIVQVNWPKSDS